MFAWYGCATPDLSHCLILKAIAAQGFSQFRARYEFVLRKELPKNYHLNVLISQQDDSRFCAYVSWVSERSERSVITLSLLANAVSGASSYLFLPLSERSERSVAFLSERSERFPSHTTYTPRTSFFSPRNRSRTGGGRTVG